MKDDYLKLIEEHNKVEKINLFEKVISMTKRAKSLYSLEESARSSLKHKPTFQAILENNEGHLVMKGSPEDFSTKDTRQE